MKIKQARTEFDGKRYWPNVGGTCTRCRKQVKVGEKSERFVGRHGGLLVRHTQECQRKRKAQVHINGEPGLDFQWVGCNCYTCLSRVFDEVRRRADQLPYTQYETLSGRINSVSRVARHAAGYLDGNLMPPAQDDYRFWDYDYYRSRFESRLTYLRREFYALTGERV